MSSDFSYTRNETLLNISNVSLTLGGKLILDKVNAKIDNLKRPGVEQGQVVGFLGPSGIGKTQLSRIIAGLQQPTSGTITITDKAIPVRRGMVGYVPQDYRVFPHRTVLSNLIVAARKRRRGGGVTYNMAKAAARDYLKRFDLLDHADKYPSQLSGGQRQRLSIAQQLLCSEYYIVMDEPFSGLDVKNLRRVLKDINKVSLSHEHMTIIIVTHDVTAALSAADTIWLMGRRRDPEGEVLPGSYIVDTIDTIERNLAWHPEVHKQPGFHELVDEIKDRFEVL